MKYFWILLTTILFSCTKDLKTFDGQSSIYFVNATLSSPSDRSDISFALGKPSLTDSLIRLQVRIIGESTSDDREYKLVIADTSTAIAGEDFELLNDRFVIKAGEVSDYIQLKLKRTAAMQDTSLSIGLELHPNEYFMTMMENRVTNSFTGATLSFTSHTVYVNDVLKKPARWIDAYFGTFSRKKLALICELFNVTPEYLDKFVGVAELTFFGKFTQRYLNDKKAMGETIYEEDGVTEMVMGPNSQ
jgi:hypothetical protein